MKRKPKKNLKKVSSKINDKKINRRNKKLMMEKIFSYSPCLIEGVEKYKDANRNFMFLIFLGALLADFLLISLPCCILAIVFLVKMLQLIKYRNINTIVNILGRDLAFKGIYDKGKIENLIEDFRDKYGEDIFEYKELTNMVEKYEALVTKIEYVINNMNIQCKENYKEESSSKQESINPKNTSNDNKEYLKKRVKDYYKDFNDKLSLTYKNEDGEIKKINRAIEFFDDKDKNGDKASTVILKSNKRGEDSKLTVYLYKKSSDLQKNAL